MEEEEVCLEDWSPFDYYELDGYSEDQSGPDSEPAILLDDDCDGADDGGYYCCYGERLWMVEVVVVVVNLQWK